MMSNKLMIATAVVLSLLLVTTGVVWLSTSAETLDEVAERFGANESPLWNPPIPDYEIPNLEGNVSVNFLVGSLFTLVIFGVTFAVGRIVLMQKRRRQ